MRPSNNLAISPTNVLSLYWATTPPKKSFEMIKILNEKMVSENREKNFYADLKDKRLMFLTQLNMHWQ